MFIRKGSIAVLLLLIAHTMYPMQGIEQTAMTAITRKIPRDVWGIIADYLPGDNKFLNILIRYLELPDSIYDKVINKMIIRLEKYPEAYFRVTHQDALQSTNLQKKIKDAFGRYTNSIPYTACIDTVNFNEFQNQLKSNLQRLVRFCYPVITVIDRIHCRSHSTHTLKNFAQGANELELDEYKIYLQEMILILERTLFYFKLKIGDIKGHHQVVLTELIESTGPYIGTGISVILVVITLWFLQEHYCKDAFYVPAASSSEAVVNFFLCSSEDGKPMPSVTIFLLASLGCFALYEITKNSWNNAVGAPLRTKHSKLRLKDMYNHCKQILNELKTIEKELKKLV